MTSEPPIDATIPGWKRRAARPATKADTISVSIAGTFLIIRKKVNIGTMRSRGLMRKVERKASEYSAVDGTASGLCIRLATRNTTRATLIDGTVVNIIYLMWVKRSVPDDEDASTVVSDRGETLSPKYAPEIIAPAVHPGEKPSAVPIAISATPTVAMVVQELPVIRATAAAMAQLAKRNIRGEMICRP